MGEHEIEFSINLLGRAFGIARSGYDAWKAQDGPSQRERADSGLTEPIRAAFTASGAT